MPAPETTVPVALDMANQPIWYDVYAAGPNLNVLLEVYCESAHYEEDYTLLLSVRRRSNADGVASFRLDAILSPQLTAFEPPTSEPWRLSRTNIRNYFVRWGELYDDEEEPAPGTWKSSDLRTVLRGSTPSAFGFYMTWRAAQPALPFLTWLPTATTLSKGQPAWLLWMIAATTPNQLLVKRKYTSVVDGVRLNSTSTESITLSTAKLHQLLAISARSAEAPAGAVSLDIYLTDLDGAPQSEVFRFALEEEPPARTRYFLLTNSLGGLDSFRTTGRYETALDAKLETAVRPALPGDVTELTVLANLVGSEKVKQASGWLTTEGAAWFRELQLAREVWEWRAGQFVPIVVTKRSFTLSAPDTPGLIGITFEYEDAAPVRSWANPAREVLFIEALPVDPPTDE